MAKRSRTVTTTTTAVALAVQEEPAAEAWPYSLQEVHFPDTVQGDLLKFRRKKSDAALTSFLQAEFRKKSLEGFRRFLARRRTSGGKGGLLG
jgi:hypothetical protein